MHRARRRTHELLVHEAPCLDRQIRATHGHLADIIKAVAEVRPLLSRVLDERDGEGLDPVELVLPRDEHRAVGL